MITVITDPADLSPVLPYKLFEHNPGDGIVVLDTIGLYSRTTSPNCSGVIETQVQYLKIQPGRSITIYHEHPDVDFNTFANTQQFGAWADSQLIISNDRVLIHRYDAHPLSTNAQIESRDGFMMDDSADFMYVCIDQNSGENNLTVWY